MRVARANSYIETLPVMDDNGRLVGIIRAEDLHRVLDTDVASHLITAEDIAIPPPIAVPPDANLLEALRELGTRDVETLPVESRQLAERQLVGLLLRSDVMHRYRMVAERARSLGSLSVRSSAFMRISAVRFRLKAGLQTAPKEDLVSFRWNRQADRKRLSDCRS